MAKVNITKKEYQKQIDKKKKGKSVKLEKSKQIKVQQKTQNTEEKKVVKVENAQAVKVPQKRKKKQTSLKPLEVQPVYEKKKKKKKKKTTQVNKVKPVETKVKPVEVKTEPVKEKPIETKVEKEKSEPKKVSVEQAKSVKVPTKKKKPKKQKGAHKIKVPTKVKMISARVLLGKVNETSFEIVKEKNEDTVVTALKDLKKFIKSGEREVVEVEKTSILTKIIGVIIILAGAVSIGVLLYKPIDMKAADKEVKYHYGEWEAEQVRFCLVSPDGKYFENDHVKYEFDASRDTCIKLTRDRSVE